MPFSSKQIEILKTVEALISEKGINATSIREIANSANINVAMVNYYFGSKDQMIESLFEYRIGIMHEFLSKIKDESSMNTRERLEEILRKYLDSILNNTTFHRIMVREFSLDTISNSIYKKIIELKLKTVSMLNAILDEGFEKNEFKNKVSGEFLLALVIGSSSYLIMNQKMYRVYWNCKTQNDFNQIIVNQHIPNVLKSIDSILEFTYEK